MAEVCHCGHEKFIHTDDGRHCMAPECPCGGFMLLQSTPEREQQWRSNPTDAIRSPLEFAFIIQDPCGEPAIELAREVLQLITDRDDVTVSALLPEIRYLNRKYPMIVGAPARIAGSKPRRKR